MAVPAFWVAPMARVLPSDESAIDSPDLSPAASPSMSLPRCTQAEVPLFQVYTRTCPASLALPSFKKAPMAIVLPSDESATEDPDKSNTASPSMSLPRWVHDWPERVAEAPAISKVKQIALQVERICFFIVDCFTAAMINRAHFPLCNGGAKYNCQNVAIR